MKTFSRFASPVLIVAALMLAAPLFVPDKAHASDDWKATFTAPTSDGGAGAVFDGGPSQSATISPLSTYDIQCARPACYKTGTAVGLAPDCTKDYTLEGDELGTLNLLTFGGGDGGLTNIVRKPKLLSREFEAAGNTRVAVQSVDTTTDPACRLLLKSRPPPNGFGQSPSALVK